MAVMKKILLFMIFAGWLYSSAFAADWKALADSAVQLSPGAILHLENKTDPSAQDIYMLTMVYYREYQRAKLKKLFNGNKNKMPDSPAMKLLQGIMLLRDHRHQESRDVLTTLIKMHPEFYPAQVTLSHLDYLQKDFAGSYRRARQMIEKRGDLSRFHMAMSLMLASGSQGVLTKKYMIRAIPAYFEVNGYFKEVQKLMPDSAEAFYSIGSYHLLTPAIAGGDLEKAIVLLEKSRRMTPLNPAVYLRLAQAKRAKGLSTVAQQYLNKAIDIDPQDELLQDYLSGEKEFLDVP